ncbi:ATP-binding protein [uncultured Desulfovibrio sp.]|uniref:ATP-binding protein n=1 Tax=uncultured Desulfovibrio sp. TaxID=167968 RepID=UPI0026183489|nr:ATP-binding protein [uncultured Desulfovibrio sp.]
MSNLSISITKEYKNIKEQSLYDLPNMIILTGRNGAGKTNFLEAVYSRASGQNYATTSIDDCIVNKILSFSLGDFVGMGRGYSEANPLGLDIDNLHEDITIALGLLKVKSNNPHYGGPREWLEDRVKKWFPVVEETAKHLGKNAKELTSQELDDNFSLIMAQGKYEGRFFQTNTADIFLGYHNLKYENTLKRLRKQYNNEVLECYETDDEFIKHCGPAPWVLINDSFKEAGLPYQITFPEGNGRLEKFTPKLVGNESQQEIQYSSLSSGEKTLFKIALSIFNSKQKENFPQILLLDEIDASLHPEMINRLLKILATTFVENYGIKVILTTHSPTTVAVSRDEYIYSVENGRIIKTSKEETLKKLLQGVPALGVIYRNVKQVFVESKYDVDFYNVICNSLNLQAKTDSLLNFISSGSSGSGSAEQTKQIVKSLGVDSTVPSVYGIIDWDTKNSSNGRISVLGENLRYSRENYTFDPLYFGLLRIRDKLFSPDDEKWFKEITVSTILAADNDLLQAIYSYSYRKNYYDFDALETQEMRLVNGYTMLCQKKILNMNGHKLAEEILEKNNTVGRYRGRSEKYENDIYEKIFKEFPIFIYKDVHDLLYAIHVLPIQQ